jgi:hypothetical protein
MAALARLQASYGIEHAADDVAGGLVDAREGGRITGIEKTRSGLRLQNHPFHVVPGMEMLQAVAVGGNRSTALHPGIQTARLCLLPEGIHPVRTERVALAEAVTRQFRADIHASFRIHAPSLPHAAMCLDCSMQSCI